ncbi:Protein of unknown function DUF3716 [Penicillium sp. IBT 16267x]|nr:Protein of unknown function DUF3716 [Penicillium sp. IBT 16267x]
MDEINDSKARVEGGSIQIVGSRQLVPCFCCESHLGVFAICIRDATGKCGNCQWLERPCSLDPDAQPVVKKVKRKARSQEELTSARDEMLSLFAEHGTLRERCRQLKASIREINGKISVLQEQKLITGIAMPCVPSAISRSLTDPMHKKSTLLIAGKQYGLLRLNTV